MLKIRNYKYIKAFYMFLGCLYMPFLIFVPFLYSYFKKQEEKKVTEEVTEKGFINAKKVDIGFTKKFFMFREDGKVLFYDFKNNNIYDVKKDIDVVLEEEKRNINTGGIYGGQIYAGVSQIHKTPVLKIKERKFDSNFSEYKIKDKKSRENIKSIMYFYREKGYF